KYLQKIAYFCREKEIRLVLFTSPLPSAYAADTENYQSYVDAIHAFAAQNGSEYWDFTLYKDLAALDMRAEDFADAHHLNGAGAQKFTTVLCDVMRRSDAGEDVAVLFYSTLEEKLRLSPDATYSAAN
ncbi:MAG: hypothetical protein ACI4OI_04535, partial [Gemmiger sp.]